MRLALIDIEENIHEIFHLSQEQTELNIRYPLPNGDQVSPIINSWTDGFYIIVPVEEFELPEGKMKIGNPQYEIDTIEEELVVIENYEIDDIPIIIPERVTSRQFKFQLIDMDLYDMVEAWIDMQDKKTQIGFDTSSTFARTDPMLNQGFVALGFTEEQVDAFFLAASQL